MLIKHEGFVETPYQDTLGIWTVGVGRNLSRPMADHEIMYLLKSDIETCEEELSRNLSWFNDLDQVRRDCMINLCFNMGYPRLSSFNNALSEMAKGNFELAADHFLDSRWRTQVGKRAEEICHMIKTGFYS